MKYLLRKDLFKNTKEEVVRTEIGEVVLRLEAESLNFGIKIQVYDKYHVPIGNIKRSAFSSGGKFEIIYDERSIATIYKKRRMFKRNLVIETVEGDLYNIKGDVPGKEYVFARTLKNYARISNKAVNKSDLFSMETKDKRLRFVFLCSVIALSI